MTKIFQSKIFLENEIDFSYDKYIARPLNRQKFLNSRSLLSGTRSNGRTIFEKCVSKILVNFWRLSYFPEIRKCWEFSVPVTGDFISIRHSAHPGTKKKIAEPSPVIKTEKKKHFIHRPRSSINAIKKCNYGAPLLGLAKYIYYA